MSTYDPQLKSLVEKKTKIRMALREEFIKQVYNPHRHATGEGGTVFDPAHQRYLTMSNQRHRFFKPTVKTSLLGLGLVLVPSIVYIKYVLYKREELEDIYRTGQISYRDRHNKYF